MVKIITPGGGGDPSAAAIAKLGEALFGDRTASMLNREKLLAAQRTNVETRNLMDKVKSSSAQALAADGVAQAMMIGAGYDPKDFGSMALLGGAVEYGARDPRTHALQVGTGNSFSETSDAFDSELAEKARNNDLMSGDRRYAADTSLKGSMYGDDLSYKASTENNTANNRRALEEAGMKPYQVMGPDGKPILVRTDAAIGSAPVLSETDQKGTLLGQNFDKLDTLNPYQRQVLDANPTKGKATRISVGPNGETTIEEAENGALMPTNGRATNEQTRISAADDFLDVADKYGKVLQANPNSVGGVGFVRDKTQEVATAVGNMVTAMGGSERVNQDLQLAREEVLKVGGVDIMPELYDPSISEAKLLGNLLVFKGAAALADQKGASLSRQDVEQFKTMLGDPQGFFESAQSLQTKLKVASDLIGGMRSRSVGALTKGYPGVPPIPPVPGTTSAAPMTPVAVPATEEHWVRGPDGRLVRAQ